MTTTSGRASAKAASSAARRTVRSASSIAARPRRRPVRTWRRAPGSAAAARCRMPGSIASPGTGGPPSTSVTAAPVARQRLGDPQRALQMPDAEQPLDMETDDAVTARPFARSSGILSRSTDGAPSRSSRKRCAAAHDSRAGGLPSMSQPAASAKTARITPLWVIAAVGSRAPGDVAQAAARPVPARRAGFRRRAGGNRARAASDIVIAAAEPCAQLRERLALPNRPNAISVNAARSPAVDAEQPRRLDRPAQRAGQQAKPVELRRQPPMRQPGRRAARRRGPAGARSPTMRSACGGSAPAGSRRPRPRERGDDRRRAARPPRRDRARAGPCRRAAAPIAARRSGRASSCRTAAAKALASPGGASSPVTPCATISPTPPLLPATTGNPLACASSSAMPKASLIAGQTKRSAAAERAGDRPCRRARRAS